MQPILSEGTPGGLMIVLDHPNKTAWNARRFLVGVEKQMILGLVQAVGWEGAVCWAYAVPVFIDKVRPSHLQEWGAHLRGEVRRMSPTKILSVGSAGYSILVERADETGYHLAKITQVRGKIYSAMLWENDQPKDIPLMPTIPQYFCFSEDGIENFRDLSGDIERLISCEHANPIPDNKLVIIESAVQLKKELLALASAPVISVDIETSGLNFKADKIESIGLAKLSKDRTKAYCVIIPHTLLLTKVPSEYDTVKRLLKAFLQGKSYSGMLCLHNAKFDLKFISEWLGERIINTNIRDTLLMNYLIDERPINHKTAPHGLKKLARTRYDADDYEFDWKTFWAVPVFDRDWSDLYKYLGLDLYYTLRLYYDLSDELQTDFPEALFALDKIITPGMLTLTEMERQGAPVDLTHFRQTRDTLKVDVSAIMDKMLSLLEECDVIGSFNPNSPKQVASILYDTFGLPGGKEKTTARPQLETMLYNLRSKPEFERGKEFVRLLLEYRGLNKVLSTYAEPFLEHAQTGMVYAQFNLAGTGTGRLSSEKPNLQNIPQMTGPLIRKGFKAPARHVWMKADYSQLELRVAAHLSQDPRMLKAFIDGRDIHAEVAAAMFGIDPSEVTKLQRYAAKFVDFGILYGRGAASLAHGPELREYNWSTQKAQRFIDNYLNEFSALRSWMYAQRDKSVTEQESITLTGRRRRWPLVLPQNRNVIERQALNFPIQSLASDITVHALSLIDQWLSEKQMKSRLAVTVHDEVDLLVHVDELHDVAPQVKHLMENFLPVELSVPIIAEIEIGPSWGELEEYVVGEYPTWLQPF